MTVEYPTRDEIRSLCTEQSFERGINYWTRGSIQELTIDNGEIRATVRGTLDYDISIDVRGDAIHTFCSCPYDHAGDCKHVVAVLLAVDDRDIDASSKPSDEPDATETADVETLVEETTADELRTFLLDVLKDDHDLRDRFVAFVGEETGRTVSDYKQELDRRFQKVASRRGMIEHDTRIDFSQYDDLAATHRERGHVDSATNIYRAVAETIRENMNRIDDSSGHYGRELEYAIESYAKTVVDQDLGHEEKRPYIEYLFEEFLTAEHHFVSEDYDDALRILCTTTADHEYWLDLLDTHVSGISLELESSDTRTTDPGDQDIDASETTASMDNEIESDYERTDDVLYTSYFTDGPLTTDDFTGGAIDVKHLAVGPLELNYFAGDTFEELRVDGLTDVDEHTVHLEQTQSDLTELDVSSTVHTRSVLSMYVHVLTALERDDALSALYEEIYLEESRFCTQYVERLIEQGAETRAIEVVKDGIDTFDSSVALRWLAAELYRDRDAAEYQELLTQLFLEYGEWDAYDRLKDACESQQWQTLSEEFEEALGEHDRERLIAMYVHEGERQKAFDELQAAGELSWLRRYREPVAPVSPADYLEVYKAQLLPFVAGDTGRRHYRAVIDHLEELQELVSEERFAEFLDFLKTEHSNRPAFLDELEKAGF